MRHSRAVQPKLKVGFVLLHNFTLTAFSTFVDVLRLAGDEGDRSRPIACDWRVMSANRMPVRSSCGIEVRPTSGLVDPSGFDYVVVVGGLLHDVPPLPPETAAYLHRAAAAGVPLVGVCTASFVLCRLGLMEHRKCCVSWYHYRDFLEEFPNLVPVADLLFVIDGGRITCSGGAGVADLAARLVARHLGEAHAQKALHILLVDRPRDEASPQPAPQPDAQAGQDRRVQRALLMMEQNLADPLTIPQIASRLGLGARQFERLFHEQLGRSPYQAYLDLRLTHGQWMLKNTANTTAQIAADLGFVDSSHFSRAIKARLGVTPAAFRKACRAGVSGAVRPQENADRRVYG